MASSSSSSMCCSLLRRRLVAVGMPPCPQHCRARLDPAEAATERRRAAGRTAAGRAGPALAAPRRAGKVRGADQPSLVAEVRPDDPRLGPEAAPGEMAAERLGRGADEEVARIRHPTADDEG